MLIGSHAVFQDVSWEGIGLLVQPILEHSLGFSMILGQDMGGGDEEETSGGKFKQGVEIQARSSQIHWLLKLKIADNFGESSRNFFPTNL